jgi:hypothetical protein
VGDSAQGPGRAIVFFVTIVRIDSTGPRKHSMTSLDAGRGGPWSGGGRQRKHAGGSRETFKMMNAAADDRSCDARRRLPRQSHFATATYEGARP